MPTWAAPRSVWRSSTRPVSAPPSSSRTTECHPAGEPACELARAPADRLQPEVPLEGLEIAITMEKRNPVAYAESGDKRIDYAAHRDVARPQLPV